jgi:NAD(P)-dependent dehydrogenase (short-subunit alcohol dehydrogenase family)
MSKVDVSIILAWQGGEKHIVNTASAAGLYSQHRATMAPYVASKHCAFVACQVLRVPGSGFRVPRVLR